MYDSYRMMQMMAEDVGTPELRVYLPRERKQGLLRRLVNTVRKAN